LLQALHKARESTAESDSHTDIVIGGFEWEHNSSRGADVIAHSGKEEHHPVTFIRDASPDSAPDKYDFSIEFDVTSYAKSDLRIIDVYVDVKNWIPIGRILRIVPYMGLGEKRQFFCLIGKEHRAYPCRFEVPKGYVKLRERELEVISLQINAINEGIYDLAVSIHYSVGGRMGVVSTDTISDVWFVSPRRQ
jgi:hypothetical protein